MNNRLRVVLDTNILLVSISSKSKYHWVFSSLLNKDYNLYISNEILLEYEEIISSKYNVNVAKNIIRVLLHLDNVYLINPFFKWNLIEKDEDDNKFIDCYVSANCEVLVSNDRHFECLKSINFPKVNLLKIDEFKKVLKI